jgi:hypothetical protein
MRGGTAAILLALVGGPLGGCGDDTSSGDCRVTTDCPAGQLCVEGRCVGGADADAEVGADADGDVGDAVDGEVDSAPCPTRICGGACCASG